MPRTTFTISQFMKCTTCTARQPPKANHSSFTVSPATTTAEFRAAAFLRAASFYSYPSDRSDFAKRAHLRMKADAAWKAIEEKVAGTDVEYKDILVIPFIATISAPPPPPTPGDDDDTTTTILNVTAEQQEWITDIRNDMPDSSCMIPGQGTDIPPKIVIGTLDLNQGAAKLPAEELIGHLPTHSTTNYKCSRAYLSNVCVANAARRRGVAAALIKAAERKVVEEGEVTDLYVHVVCDNNAAVELYRRCGFEVEQEESEAVARSLNRPRRLLLHKNVVVTV